MAKVTVLRRSRACWSAASASLKKRASMAAIWRWRTLGTFTIFGLTNLVVDRCLQLLTKDSPLLEHHVRTSKSFSPFRMGFSSFFCPVVQGMQKKTRIVWYALGNWFAAWEPRFFGGEEMHRFLMLRMDHVHRHAAYQCTWYEDFMKSKHYLLCTLTDR